MAESIRSHFSRTLRKYSWVFLLILLVIAVLAIQAIPTVHAGAPVDKKEFLEKFDNFLNGFGTTSFSLMGRAYEQFTQFMAPNSEKLAVNDSITGLITGIAHFLVVLYMYIGLIKEGMRGDVREDMIYWFRIFAGTAVAFVLVSSITTVTEGIYKLGGYIVNNIQQDITEEFSQVSNNTAFDKTNDKQKDKLLKTLDSLPGLGGIKELITSLEDNDSNALSGSGWYNMQSCAPILEVLTVIVYVPLIAAVFLMYSVVFELKLRQIFAPIAIASVSYEGARGSGVRYLKKMLACFIKIAIYFVVAWLGYRLMLSFLGEFLVHSSPTVNAGELCSDAALMLIMTVLANIVSTLAMLQMGGIADEIVGA